MPNSSLDIKLESVKVVERRVEDAEQRISNTEDTMSQLLAKLEHTKARLSEAINRLEDQENRSRCNNIKIINLPECTEGDYAKDFFKIWLPKILNLTEKNDRIKMDTCHCSPAQLQTESTRPRIAYIRLHNYADKQLVTQKARKMGEIAVSGNRIHFFEDFSLALEKRQRSHSSFLLEKRGGVMLIVHEDYRP